MNLTAHAFQHLRQTHRGRPDQVWQALVTACDGNFMALKNHLYTAFGIGLLHEVTNSVWRVIEFHSGPIPYAHVVADGQAYLAFEDPWARTATGRLIRMEVSGVRLALASPLAMRTLQRMTTGASDHNTSISASATTGLDAVTFVNKAIERGYLDGASDVHFESGRAGIRTQLRVDGVMRPGESMDSATLAEQVISRIKVMASLDITERRTPQDGRFRWTESSGNAIDMRVSIMPSIFGEDAVLRLLDRAQLRDGQTTINLTALGFDESTSDAIRQLANKPHGLLLVTGPTGSGKTTTVYAALSEANNRTEKIITIEDPVEYELTGVLQIPVNEQKGLTFANGLRSILRHDPDKILVGEIRDSETAEIAIHAALTGHLVFTTVHANSLFDVLGRFQHFGVDPFALASALNGVLVQRLLRKLCSDCKHEQLMPHPTSRTTGCPSCRHTGYKGRMVVAEVLVLDDPLRDLIITRASIGDMNRHLAALEVKSLRQRAMECVKAQLTTLEEVERVLGRA